MVGAIDVPLGHLAGDDPGNRPWSSCQVEAGISRPRKVSHERAVPVPSSGGKALWYATDWRVIAERGHEADAVRVVAGVDGGVGHQGADGVVAAQMSPDLLQLQLGRFRPQHGAGSALMGLELVEGKLDLPALRVGRGQLGR